MTTPTGGGFSSVGTIYGSVQLRYVSTGVSKAIKDGQQVQSTLTQIGNATKGIDKATGSVTSLTGSLSRLNKASVTNPTAGVGRAVENEVSKAQKALSGLQRMIQNFRGTKGTGTLTITSPVKINPSSVTVDTRAIQAAAQKSVKPIDLDVPVNVKGGSGGGSGAGGIASLTAGLGRLNPALLTATAAGTALATVFGKGFSRLQSIDQATVKLSALGKTTEEIKSISKSALDSVQGTAFGLQEAFNVAAAAINAGIKPGKELDKYLQATANTASLAGVSMLDLGDAFNRAATQGKLTGEVMQMLYDRQIPVLKLLADEYGVTQAKAREMVSDGQVSFDRFMSAMSKTGGAAKAMGNTITGSWNNLKAAVSRLGANLLAPLFAKKNASDASTIASAIQQVTKAVDGLGNFVKTHSRGIVDFFGYLGKGAVGAAQVFVGVVGFMTDAIIKFIEVLGDLGGWAAQSFGFIADLVGADGVAKNMRDFADAAHAMGTGIRANRDANLEKWTKALDNSQASISNWITATKDGIDKAGQLGSAMGDAAPQAIELTDALEKLDIKATNASKAIEGTNEEFAEFIKSVKDKGGTQALIDQLEKIRDQFENGGRQVKSFASAMRLLGDSTASVSDKADALIKSLQGLGLLPGGDAIASYNEEFDKMTNVMSTLIDMTDTLGNALSNTDGTLNLNTKNGRALLTQLESIRKEMFALASSGEVDPSQVYDRTLQGVNQLLQAQAGFTPDQAAKVAETYLLPKEKFQELFKNKTNPKGALEGIFKDDPAKLDSAINLLTTSEDVLKQIVGPDGQLHVPTVLDVKPEEKAPPTPGATQQNQPGFINPDFKIDTSTTQRAVPPPPPQGSSSRLLLGGLGADSLRSLGDNPAALNKALTDNPEIASALQGLVDQAKNQGQNMGEALAQGIESAEPAVKEALLKLAGLAGDYLGHSPAKYGPLSGKGWTEERGKVFTRDWAKGISSESATAASAVEGVAGAAAGGFKAGGAVTLDDSITQVIKDFQQFSDFGKKLLEFGNQIADIAFGIAKVANDFSGGALFPKSYRPIQGQQPKFPAVPGWNPQANQFAGAPQAFQPQGGNGPVAAPSSLGKNAGQQDIASYIISSAMAQGYSRAEANDFVVQAFGESGLRANAFGATTGDATGGASGIFQFTPGTWADFGKGDPLDPQANIDAYLKLARARDPRTGSMKERLAAISVGGPAAPSNVGHWDKALQGAAPFIAGAGDTGAGPLADYKQWYPKAGQGGAAGPIRNILEDINGKHSGAAAEFAAGLLSQAFPEIQKIGGARNDSMPYHREGRALDVMIPGWNTPEGKALGDRVKKWALDNADKIGLEDVIWQDFWQPADGGKGHLLGRTGQGPTQAHMDHNHLSFRPGFTPQAGMGMGVPGGILPPQAAGQPPAPVTLTGQAADDLAGINKNTLSMPTMTQGMQDLVANDPVLRNALQNPSALNQESVVPVLQDIDTQIALQNKKGTPDGKLMADQLSQMKNNFQTQFGMEEGPSGLDQATSIASGVSSIAADIFGLFDQGLKTISATQDIADTLVRGIANTKDVNRIVDDVQEWITLFQKGFQTASDITGLAAQIAGAAGSGDPTGIGSAAAGGLQGASAILGLVAQGLAAVNTGIDLAQEAYAIATKYMGRFLTSWFGLPGARDIKYLLNERTGQMQVYSSENPQDKQTFNTIGRMLGGSRYNGTGQAAPQNYFSIYQGPGQDPRDTMNEAMFAIKSSGVGAFGYADE